MTRPLKVLLIHGCCHGGEHGPTYTSQFVATTAAVFGDVMPDRDFEFRAPFYGEALFRDIALEAPVSELERSILAEGLARLEPGETEVISEGPVDWLREQFLPLFASDVARYLEDRDAATTVWRIVAGAWREFEPDIVVAHSLGTAVAWEVLAQQQVAPAPPALLTLGSPLAMDSFVDNLRVDPGSPTGTRWFNMTDPSDVVAGGVLLKGKGYAVDHEGEYEHTRPRLLGGDHTYDGCINAEEVRRRLPQVVAAAL